MYIVKNLNYCIRNGVFETNSSSIHNFVLRKKKSPVQTHLKAGDLPYIPIALDIYEHKFDILRTEYDKLSYLLTYVKSVEILFKHAGDGLFDCDDDDSLPPVSLATFAATEGYQLLNEVIQKRFDRYILPVNTGNSYIEPNATIGDSLEEALCYFGGYDVEEVIFNPRIEIWVGDWDPDEIFNVSKERLNNKWKYIRDAKGFQRKGFHYFEEE